MSREPKTLICPICYCLLARQDFLEPDDRDLWEAAPEDDLVIEEIVDLIVDVLVAHGLGDVFTDWQGEIIFGGNGRGIVLSGSYGLGGPQAKKNGTLIVRAELAPARVDPEEGEEDV